MSVQLSAVRLDPIMLIVSLLVCCFEIRLIVRNVVIDFIFNFIYTCTAVNRVISDTIYLGGTEFRLES